MLVCSSVVPFVAWIDILFSGPERNKQKIKARHLQFDCRCFRGEFSSDICILIVRMLYDYMGVYLICTINVLFLFISQK